MKREKRLIKNFGIFALANASIKVFSFLLIPVYTSYLSTDDFGIFELVVSTVSLLVPIATLDIADSTLRFSMEEKENLYSVYRISHKYCLMGTVYVIGLLAANRVVGAFKFLINSEFIVIILFLLSSLTGILVGYAKAINKVRAVAISGVLGAAVTIILNIFLLILIKSGIKGYFIAYIIGSASQLLYLYICVNSSLQRVKYTKNRKLERELLHYSVPLIANNVAWWVNSAMDRYFVTFFCGISENGVYSLSYKIPTIINVVQSLFHQAWTISAIQEYDSDDSRKFYFTTYRTYNVILVIICSAIMLVNKVIARLMYAKTFFEAWRYVPFLCIGFMFLGLANYIGGIFNAYKQSNIIAVSTIISALLNCIFNFCLIPFYGALGAAIATALSYMAIWIIRTIIIHIKTGLQLFMYKDIVAYILLVVGTIDVFITGLRFELIHAGIIIVLLLLYQSEIFSSIKNVKNTSGI